jgi:carbon monoxide dehydrogenase subunit G
MGTEKYISDVKVIQAPIEKVYEKLSNLKNLNNLVDPEKMKRIKEQVPNAPDIKLDNFQASEDECSFTLNPLGRVGIRVVEREPNKTIKLQGGESLPVNFNCWLQLLPVDEDSCKIRLTLHADMNPMIKMMVNKHLKEGVNKVADALTVIPYQ